jgi:hypothetical protein
MIGNAARPKAAKYKATYRKPQSARLSLWSLGFRRHMLFTSNKEKPWHATSN